MLCKHYGSEWRSFIYFFEQILIEFQNVAFYHALFAKSASKNSVQNWEQF